MGYQRIPLEPQSIAELIHCCFVVNRAQSGHEEGPAYLFFCDCAPHSTQLLGILIELNGQDLWNVFKQLPHSQAGYLQDLLKNWDVSQFEDNLEVAEQCTYMCNDLLFFGGMGVEQFGDEVDELILDGHLPQPMVVLHVHVQVPVFIGSQSSADAPVHFQFGDEQVASGILLQILELTPLAIDSLP